MSRIPDLAGLRSTVAAGWSRAGSLDIAGVTADSREVHTGDLFVAVSGTARDGRAFIAEAVANGAAAVLAPTGTEWPPGVPPRPLIEDPEPRRRLAQLASAIAGTQPALVIAVTGTNGKTSTVEFLRQRWALAGHCAASLGTLGLRAPGFEPGPGLTTPDPVTLAAVLADLARARIERASLEASSHGLDQYRLDGVRLAAAAYTNLTRDHLDYHGTLEKYRAAKLRLFDTLLPWGAPAIASSELEPASLGALRDLAAGRRIELGTVGENGSLIRVLRAMPRPDGQELEVQSRGARYTLRLALPGRFQADNALMAVALAEAAGQRNALDLLPRLAGVRGRMELASRLPNGAAAYVDYAHTPDALERLLSALRPHTAGKLHVVFGAGGDRDRGKRPLMGQAAARLADQVIVTDDNPRTEDPAAIRAELLVGCPGALDIGGREPAIEAALNMLGAGDVLVVAGKGHEQGQTIGTTVIPFDDVAVIRRLAGQA
ncbi:MAG: UDP-N-acetylmuramoyl-L-alanyl-D-glutamate--2,6-diaminopimelate ligase [Acetobacteraceae bacterium]|nr:UDP-N-acetylmuramoyl-L-alanyl-D-glutamate--2,6-diaminopimelate ligase [Acetobacteraceae bacterium]